MGFKSYFAELLGTFILVFIGTGSIVTVMSRGDLTIPGIILIALTFGLTLTAIVYTFGDISGAHVNPAVSIGAFIAGKLRGIDVIPYIIMQLIGAVIASFFILVIAGASFGIGANTVGFLGLQSALIVEIVLTMLFVLVILKTTSEQENQYAATAIGSFLIVAHLFAISISGSSLNPARSFGPAVILGGIALSQLWIYIIGPLIGAVLGAVIFKFFEF